VPSIRTLQAPHAVEIDKVKGSRFLGSAFPVETEAGVAESLQRLARTHRDATHHAFAWRLAPSAEPGAGRERWRTGDDGEPAGSAGRPILQELDARELVDTLVVVTRWYGGTKLGVGGLVRAYGAAAAAVLEEARVRTTLVRRRLRVHHPYACSGAVAAVLAAHGLVPERGSYEASVSLEVAVPVEVVDEVVRELRDATSGLAEVTPLPA